MTGDSRSHDGSVTGDSRSPSRALRRSQARELARRFINRWVVLGVLAEALAAILNATLSHGVVITPGYLLPVLVVALVDTGERTAALAVIAGVLAVLSGVWHHDLFTALHVYRLAVVIGGGALAALGATFRSRALMARDRMELLAAIAEIADGSPGVGESLERLAGALVPAVADVCTLTVFEGERARRVVIRSPYPWLREGIAAVDVPPRQALDTARSGETLLIRRFAAPAGRGAVEVSAEAMEIMDRTDLNSVICAPLHAAGETVALLIIGVGPSGRRYAAEDVRFARTVASRAALAIRSARLLNEVWAARQRMEATVGSLADAVTIRETGGRLIYANDAAKSVMGLSPEADIASEDPVDLFERFDVTDESGDPLDIRALPSMRLLAGEEPEPLVLQFVDREIGAQHWRVLKSTPLRDAGGTVEAAVTIIEDITETKRAELRSAFLSRASEILSSSLDYGQTLRNVAELAVPDLADWCGVDLVDEQGEREQVVAAHRDPAKRALAQRLRERSPARIDPHIGLGYVLRSGESALYPRIDEALLQRVAAEPEQLALLREVGMRSALVVPMRAGARIVGIMTMVNAESGRVFTEDDVSFAEQIAARAGVAVENARLYSERARIATTLQHSLLPDALPEIAGWEVGSLYRPASSDGAVEVGGDFYDAFAVGDGWVVLIGDVTGKGVEAAAMTALVRHGARFVADYVAEPAQILARLDRSLRAQASLSLCTALCLRIDGARVRFASAGHPLPLLVGAGGVRSVGRAGDVLGAFPDGQWPMQEIVLAPDEVLFLYTDGVTDTVGESGRFGEERLCLALEACGPEAPQELLRCLDATLERFQLGSQADDTAALALRLAGDPHSAEPVGPTRPGRVD